MAQPGSSSCWQSTPKRHLPTSGRISGNSSARSSSASQNPNSRVPGYPRLHHPHPVGTSPGWWWYAVLYPLPGSLPSLANPIPAAKAFSSAVLPTPDLPTIAETRPLSAAPHIFDSFATDGAGKHARYPIRRYSSRASWSCPSLPFTRSILVMQISAESHPPQLKPDNGRAGSTWGRVVPPRSPVPPGPHWSR